MRFRREWNTRESIFCMWCTKWAQVHNIHRCSKCTRHSCPELGLWRHADSNRWTCSRVARQVGRWVRTLMRGGTCDLVRFVTNVTTRPAKMRQSTDVNRCKPYTLKTSRCILCKVMMTESDWRILLNSTSASPCMYGYFEKLLWNRLILCLNTLVDVDVLLIHILSLDTFWHFNSFSSCQSPCCQLRQTCCMKHHEASAETALREPHCPSPGFSRPRRLGNISQWDT